MTSSSSLTKVLKTNGRIHSKVILGRNENGILGILIGLFYTMKLWLDFLKINFYYYFYFLLGTFLIIFYFILSCFNSYYYDTVYSLLYIGMIIL